MKSLPSLRVLSLTFFLALSLVPYGWNKFDNPTHAGLLYVLGGLLLFLTILSWKRIMVSQTFDAKFFTASNIINITAVLLPILSYLAFVFSPIHNLGWSEVMVMAAGIATFVITRTFTEKERSAFLRIFALLAIVSAFLGLWQYFVRDESRIAGPFFESAFKPHYWPNAFAMFLLMVWPLPLTWEGQRRVRTLLQVLSVAVLLSALILTFSRAAFLVLVVQGILLLWMRRREILKIKPILLSTFTLLLAAGSVLGLHALRSTVHPTSTNSFATKVTFTGTERQTSFTERAQFMSGAGQLALEKPWFGHGPFSFRFIYPSIQKDFLAISDHPHNWVLKLAMEQGIPVALLFIILIKAVLYRRKDIWWRGEGKTSAFVMVAAIGVLLHNLVDYNINFLSNQLGFWAILGILAIPGEGSGAIEKKGRGWGAVTLIGIFLVASSLLIEGYFSFTRQYDRMAFPRELFLNEARGENAENQTKEAVEATQHHLKLNPYDAYAWDFLGHTLEPTDPDSALEAYRRAIESDGANVFSFYLHYLTLGQKLGHRTTVDYVRIAQQARGFLVQYPTLAESNVHYTAQTGNALAAIELASLLNEEELAQRIEAARKKWVR